MCSGKKREARAEEGSGKFGGQGLVSEQVFRSLGINREEAKELSRISNHGLSKSTWSNYATAERMLRKCEKETKRNMELPLGQAQVLQFINWLIKERKAKHGTI